VRPGTDTFIWEQSPPYDTLGDYGTGVSGTWQRSDYWIFAASSGSKTPATLFQPRSRTTYRLGEFSPDGRFLSLLVMHDGRVKLAIYNFQRHRLTEFAVAPRFPGYQSSPDWTWIDSRRLAVAAYPAGHAGPWPLTFRRAIGKRMTESWEKSWRGKDASVDEYESSTSDSTRPLPGRLVIVDMLSGRVRQLASGQFAGLNPSPDGRWLAAVRQSTLPQYTLQRPHTDWTYARSTLMLYSVSGRPETREVAPELDVLPDSMVWNSKGKILAFFAWNARAELSSGDFWTFESSTSSVEVAPHTGLALASQRAHGNAQWPERAIWMQDSLAVFGRATPGHAGSFTYAGNSNNGILDSRVGSASVSPHWFLLDRDGTPRDLTPGMKWVSPNPVIAVESQALVVGDGHIWRLNSSGPPMDLFPSAPQLLDVIVDQSAFDQRRLSGGGGFFPVAGASGTLAQIHFEDGSPVFSLLNIPSESAALAVSRSGTMLAQVGFGKGAVLAMVRQGRQLDLLGELNPFLDRVAETRWLDFPYSNADGSAISQLFGCLLLPTDYRPGYRYPLIVEVYPDRGGHCAAPEKRRRFAMAAHPDFYSEHLLAAKGFVVLRPDTSGGISGTADGPQAGLSAVVDRAIDSAIACGYADPNRIGLMGFSQGGFASLWLATQSRRYKAVVSLNGWSDLMTNFFDMKWAQELVPTELAPQGNLDRYLMSNGSFSMGGTPWQVPQRYIQNSPLWRSDGVSAPVLLIHSDMDDFDDSYKQFFSSLFIQKKDAKLLIYRGEGHSPSSPANIRDMWEHILTWFDQYLEVNRDPKGKMILE
jgi:dienelactone hydrolase